MRPDGSRHGGILVCLVHAEALLVSLAVPLIFLDWSNRKLERMCRWTLSAGAQSAANAMDMQEWTKVSDSKRVVRCVEGRDFGAGNQGKKRMTVVVTIANQRLRGAGGCWWTHSLQELADGLIKTSGSPTSFGKARTLSSTT